MKYEVICQKCGSELKVVDFKKYLGKDEGDYVIPITRTVVEQCRKCIEEAELSVLYKETEHHTEQP